VERERERERELFLTFHGGHKQFFITQIRDEICRVDALAIFLGKEIGEPFARSADNATDSVAA
jgi:hypothetical protein